MSDILDPERFSLDSWARRSKDGADMPAVLYFDRRKPEGFDESGIYICFQDFRNLKLGYNHDVPLTTAYHVLVFHFSKNNPGMFKQARRDLYNNPSNRANWNENSLTDRYHLHGTTLLPFAVEKPTPEFTIPGIGKFGREILGRVLFDEVMTPEPSDAELFGYGPENTEE